jgi:hypothetical protein
MLVFATQKKGINFHYVISKKVNFRLRYTDSCSKWPLHPSDCKLRRVSKHTFVGVLFTRYGRQQRTGGINPLKPTDPYRGRTAPLTSKQIILYIYSTNIGTEYFKHGIYSPFFPLENAVCFIILTCFIPVLFTFYIQGVIKLKKTIPAPKS